MDTEYRIQVWREDAWQDCGEGPWLTFLSAKLFVDAEVGAPWRIVAVVPIMQCI